MCSDLAELYSSALIGLDPDSRRLELDSSGVKLLSSDECSSLSTTLNSTNNLEMYFLRTMNV